MTDIGTSMQLSALRAAFDEAALTPARWADALHKLAEACGAPHGQLIGLGGPAAVMFNWVSDGSDGLNAILHDPSAHDPSSNYRIIAGVKAPEREVIGEDNYRAIIDGLKSQDYVRLAQEHGIPWGLQANLSTGNGQIVGLATLRPDVTTDKQRRIFTQAIPYAQTAVRIQAALDHQGTQLVAGTLEAMHLAAFVIDGAGTVQSMTPEADRLVSTGKPFRLRNNMLVANNPDDDERLQAFLAASLSAEGNGSAHHAIVLKGCGGPRPCVADIVVMPAREWTMHFRPRVIVTSRDRPAGQDSAILLREAFGLTVTEAEIAQALVSGTSRASIAERRGISEHTIRAHLKSIFGKVEVNRELELAARLRDFVAEPRQP
ncbi:helix-turn-helix transcriptional regulator [Stakelama marina]|uniref:Helix-turn-helix transcriptional regulator n=1 Tax=Stakelama marina TaxID=2826939 RepID=A0A8T4IAK1_9SPHN|nr:helix-turn-helix transcriptional regulator [Stakelama marina]MBR0551687.1 helix-turn-helix transcriptional regulator [Stakelama marina]